MPRASRWADWVEPDTTTLRLEPIFGCKPFGASTTCDDIHPNGPRDKDGVLLMPSGTNCVCMACHQSGRERHPDLRETAADTLRVKNWKPPEGGDQWSNLDLAEPTKYDGPTDAPAATKRRHMKQFSRKILPMNPDQIAREVDAGRARSIA